MNRFIILLLGVVTLCFSEQKRNIAVIDLEGNGITDNEALVLTEKLRGELFNTGVFNLLERGQMDEILKEQGFQQTGCTSSECLVEAGQLLGVNAIVAGSVGKMGNIFLISIRIIDVASARIESQAQIEIEGSIEDVLRTGISKAAYNCAGLKWANKSDSMTETDRKVPDLKTESAHTKVSLMDSDVLARNGYTAEDLHQLRNAGVSFEMLVSQKYRIIRASDNNDNTGMLLVRGGSEDVKIFLNDSLVGYGNLVLAGLPAKQYSLRAEERIRGFSYDKKVNRSIMAGSVSEVDIRVRKTFFALGLSYHFSNRSAVTEFNLYDLSIDNYGSVINNGSIRSSLSYPQTVPDLELQIGAWIREHYVGLLGRFRVSSVDESDIVLENISDFQINELSLDDVIYAGAFLKYQRRIWNYSEKLDLSLGLSAGLMVHFIGIHMELERIGAYQQTPAGIGTYDGYVYTESDLKYESFSDKIYSDSRYTAHFELGGPNIRASYRPHSKLSLFSEYMVTFGFKEEEEFLGIEEDGGFAAWHYISAGLELTL